MKQGVSCICPGHTDARSGTANPTETSLKQSQSGGDPNSTAAAEGRRQSDGLALSGEANLAATRQEEADMLRPRCVPDGLFYFTVTLIKDYF